MHVGIAGEVRCVVTKADGAVKFDTGYQKNLILNQGLDFFGGGKGYYINDKCAIGGGNSAPTINQTKLDSFIALTSGTNATSDFSYIDNGDNLYRMWEQKRYRFTGLNDANISEVGLVSEGTTSSTYYLTTRALIKDSTGNPTSISIKTGETLDIFYKIHKVVSLIEQQSVINLLDGSGGETPLNVILKPAFVGTNYWTVSQGVGTSLSNSTHLINFSSEDLSDVTSAPLIAATRKGSDVWVEHTYTPGTFKAIFKVKLGLDMLNNYPLRSLSFTRHPNVDAIGFTFLPFQVRFGRVSDDAPLTKTNQDTLEIPFEASWGRYEGEL